MEGRFNEEKRIALTDVLWLIIVVLVVISDIVLFSLSNKTYEKVVGFIVIDILFPTVCYLLIAKYNQNDKNNNLSNGD